MQVVRKENDQLASSHPQVRRPDAATRRQAYPGADCGRRRASRLALRRFLHRQRPQPEHAPSRCAGLRPVLRLVRGPQPDAAAIRFYDVATYVETLQLTHSAPGVKQQLAAVRMLFD